MKLDNETLVKLIEQAQAGDLAARNYVVEANLRLVRSIAKRFGRGFSQPDREDFQAEGTLGLLRAVQTWDPKSGTAWSTHAFWKIRNGVMGARLRLAGVKNSGVHRRIASKLAAMNESESCDPQSVADALGIKVGTVVEYLCRKAPTSPLDTVSALRTEGDSLLLQDRIPQTTFPIPGEDLEQDEVQQNRWTARLKSYAQGIGGIQGEILKARLAEIPLTEVAKKFGITKQKIHDLDKQVLRRARFDLQDLREEDR